MVQVDFLHGAQGAGRFDKVIDCERVRGENDEASGEVAEDVFRGQCHAEGHHRQQRHERRHIHAQSLRDDDDRQHVHGVFQDIGNQPGHALVEACPVEKALDEAHYHADCNQADHERDARREEVSQRIAAYGRVQNRGYSHITHTNAPCAQSTSRRGRNRMTL